jgi:hypothetical protein
MKLAEYGDILAIPFFALMCFYFYGIEKKTPIENILFFFSISGLMADLLFTYLYLYKKRI